MPDVPVSKDRFDTLIDSHKPLLLLLTRMNKSDNELRRSNMLTHSESGLDAHRSRTRSAYRLEFASDTTGFPTIRPARLQSGQTVVRLEPGQTVAIQEPCQATGTGTRARPG